MLPACRISGPDKSTAHSCNQVGHIAVKTPMPCNCNLSLLYLTSSDIGGALAVARTKSSYHRVWPSPFTSGQLARALLLALTKLHGPHSHSSASACLNYRVREAAKWLQAAFDGRRPVAKLHLAHLTFDAGQEDAALAPSISKSTSRGVCNGDVTSAPGVGRRGARTRRCSRAAAAL